MSSRQKMLYIKVENANSRWKMLSKQKVQNQDRKCHVGRKYNINIKMSSRQKIQRQEIKCHQDEENATPKQEMSSRYKVLYIKVENAKSRQKMSSKIQHQWVTFSAKKNEKITKYRGDEI